MHHLPLIALVVAAYVCGRTRPVVRARHWASWRLTESDRAWHGRAVAAVVLPFHAAAVRQDNRRARTPQPTASTVCQGSADGR